MFSKIIRYLLVFCLLALPVSQPAFAQEPLDAQTPAGSAPPIGSDSSEVVPLHPDSSTDLVGPTGSGVFGTSVVVLPNGNLVVTDPQFDPNQLGAVYLINPVTHKIISKLSGAFYDMVGYGGVAVLKNGDFLVLSPFWHNGTANIAGAVTYCSGTTGCSGVVTADNSLVGSHKDDMVGSGGITVLKNGDFVVLSPYWNNGAASKAGAVTYCSLRTGCSGVVSTANSLVGIHTGDEVGSNGITLLAGAGYVVTSQWWGNGALVRLGAVTACQAGSCFGATVSEANSLVGNQSNDQVGSNGIKALPGGAFLVLSSSWHNGTASAGAVSWCPAAGCHAAVSANPVSGNSLVGSTDGDAVGTSVVLLADGGYVVPAPFWSNGALAQYVGAVAACPPTGCTPGSISTANSIIGGQVNDLLGGSLSGGVFALAGGGFVIASPTWSNGATAHVGAVTVCPAAGCAGKAVSGVNSLIGSQAEDRVGSKILPLPSGGFVVGSSDWANGSSTQVGAVTVCPAVGCTGSIDSANSLLGSQTGDKIGGRDLVLLSNGNFVVVSPNWFSQIGAVTVCPPSGCAGMVISASNSLVGAQSGDLIGSGDILSLTGGGFVVLSSNFNANSKTHIGAATFCPAAGCKQVVSAANSLVGSQSGDAVGFSALALSNGKYVVGSQLWANGANAAAGAVTLCPAAGCTGTVSAGNSLVGSIANENLGQTMSALADGEYIVFTPGWDNGASLDAGAYTLCPVAGCNGGVSSSNSILGMRTNYGAWMVAAFDTSRSLLVVGRSGENIVSFLTYKNQLFLPVMRR